MPYKYGSEPNEFLRQANRTPHDPASFGMGRPGAQLFRGITTDPADLDDKDVLTRGGDFTDQPGVPDNDHSYGFPVHEVEVRKNIRTTFRARSAAVSGTGSLRLATGHTVGHYSTIHYRDGRVPFWEEDQGGGMYVLARDVPGYPDLPPSSTSRSGISGGDDPALSWWLGQGMPRSGIDYLTDGGAYLDEAPGVAAAIGNRQLWTQFYKEHSQRDLVRTDSPFYISHTDLNADSMARALAVVDNPQIKGHGVTHEPGNERWPDARVYQGGGNLGASPHTLIDLVVQFTTSGRAIDPTAQFGSPSTTEIGESARSGMMGFWGDAAVRGLNLDRMIVHTYNAHNGDMACGMDSFDVLLAVRAARELFMKCGISEAGNHHSTWYGIGTPLAQVWMLMLEMFLIDRFCYMDGQRGGQGMSKEGRAEFHILPGFIEHPGWWMLDEGPLPPILPLSVHSQWLRNCYQMPEDLIDMGDDRKRVISLVYRRPDGTGTLAVLADERDKELSFRFVGASNADLLAGNQWGVDGTLSTDSNGIGTLFASRGAFYVHLPVGVTDVQLVADTSYGQRVHKDQVELYTSHGSFGFTQLEPIKDPDDFRNSLLYNVDNRFGVAESVWRSGAKLSEVDSEGIWMMARFPKFNLKKAIFQAPFAYQALAVPMDGVWEAWIGNQWVQVGTVAEGDETRRLQMVFYGGMIEQTDDGNHIFTLKLEQPIATNQVRFRVTKTTVGEVRTEEGWNGMGSVLPVVASQTVDGSWPPQVQGKAIVVTPVPAAQGQNNFGWGILQDSATPQLSGYRDTDNYVQTLYGQDFGIYGDPLGAEMGPGTALFLNKTWQRPDDDPDTARISVAGEEFRAGNQEFRPFMGATYASE